MKKNEKIKPVVIFDIETTGLDTENDRIIQITLKRINGDGTSEIFTSNVNPGNILISKEAEEKTGITNEMVSKYEHTFSDIKDKLFSLINGADIAGYNIIKFDVPFLYNEFMRNGINWHFHKVKIFDLFQIWSAFEPRTLGGAGIFYNVEIDGNEKFHDSEFDVLLTEKIFNKQIEKYGDLNEIYGVQYEKFGRMVDSAGKLIIKIGDDKKEKVFINFGNKHKGKEFLDVFKNDFSYLTWISEDMSFPFDTRKKVKELISFFKKKEDHN